MDKETNRLCFCDCEGFVVDDNYYDTDAGVFGWCKTRNIPITKTETYRDTCKLYSYIQIPEKQKNEIWSPRIRRWLDVHQKYNVWFKKNFKATPPKSLLSRIFYKQPKWDNVCPSCYGQGYHGCIHMYSDCDVCNGYGGYND